MPVPVTTPGEQAAYRAGALDSRLNALESHAAIVNGSIKATGDALTVLTGSVQDLTTTLRVLDVISVKARVLELEKQAREAEGRAEGVALSGRMLAGSLAALATVISIVVVLANVLTH